MPNIDNTPQPPMRILICTNSLGANGGLEKVTIVKANAFAELPDTEAYVCFTDRGTYPEKTIYPLSPKVKVIDLGTPFWDLYPLNLKNILITAPKKFLACSKAIKRVVRDIRPDVIVTTGSYEKYSLALLSLSKSLGFSSLRGSAYRKPILVREYHFCSNYRSFIAKTRADRISAKLIFKFESNLLAKCFDKNFLLTKQDLEENRHSKKRFDYQYNPCTVNDPDISSGKEKIVVAVCRLEYQKWIEKLLDAWSLVARRLDEWQLQIIGDGSLRDYLRDYAADKGVSGSVRFVGFTHNVGEYLDKSRIICLTSRYEGFGLVLIEGMHHYNVPVSFRLPYGPQDIIDSEECGVLVEYGNAVQFAEALYALGSDDERCSRMAAKAFERSNDFALDKVINQWITHYTTLLEKKNKITDRNA